MSYGTNTGKSKAQADVESKVAEGAMKELISKENVESATAFGKEKLAELKELVEKGHWTVHKAAMLLGPLMVLSGLSSLLGTLFAPLHFLIEIYIMCAGVVSLALETSAYAQNKYLLCLKVDVVRKKVQTEARVLTTLTGRSGFYFIIATLLLAQSGTTDLLIGLYTFGLSIAMFVVGRQAATKLADLRSSMTNEAELRAKFSHYDTDRDSKLSSAELANLCSELGSMLTHHELEGALQLLDTNGDGLIDYDEFAAWWQGSTEDKLLTIGISK